MRSLFLTGFLSFLIVIGKVKGEDHECSDSKQSFTDSKWQTLEEAEYDEALGAFVLKQELTRLFKKASDFNLEDPSNSLFLYIEYAPLIRDSVDAEVFVYPNKDIDPQPLDLSGDYGESTVQIVELSKDAIGEGEEVSVQATKLGEDDEIRVTRIGIWYGDGTPEEIQDKVEAACDWSPPTTPTPTPTTTPAPTPLTKVDCIDTLEQYESNTAWDFGGGLANISDSKDIDFFPNPPQEGEDVFYLEGDGDRKIFLRRLPRDGVSDEDSFFLYIKYYSRVSGAGKVTVNMVDDNDDYSEVLGATPDSKWGERVFKLVDDLVAPLDLEIYVDDYQEKDYFLIDKIAIVSGQRDERSDEEMIADIEELCKLDSTTPTEPTTESSTTDDSIKTTSTTDDSINTSETTDESTVTTETTDIVDPGNSTTPDPGNESSTSPPQIEPIVVELRDEEDFKAQEWKTFPEEKYNYAASPEDLPVAITNIKLIGYGIFFFEGDNTRSQIRIEKTLSYANFSQPTSMYIKYYTFILSSGEPRSVLVTPTDFETSLKPASGKTWGEELVKLNPSEDQSKVQITINGFRANEYFLLDEIYLVHGKDFESVEEIKEFVNQGNGGAKDDDGFGTTELVLVTVLPAIAIAVVCAGLYFYLRRR